MTENENEQNEQSQYVVDLLRTIVQEFTDHHKDLEITAARLGSVLIIKLTAHAAETPRIIGSQGKHVSSLQTIMERVGRRIGKRVRLEVQEARKGQKRALRPYERDPNWDPSRMEALLEVIVTATTGIEHTPIKCEQVEGNANFSVEGEAGRELEQDPDLVQAIDRILLAVGRHQGQQVFLESATLTR